MKSIVKSNGNKPVADLLPHQGLALWLVEFTGKGHIATEWEVANFLSSYPSIKVLTDGDIYRFISPAREYAEEKLGQFILRIKNRGWRVAKGVERPRYAGKVVHISCKWHDRARRAFNALSMNEKVEFRQGLLLRAENDFRRGEKGMERFSDYWLKFLSEERKQLEDKGVKLIAEKV